MAQARGPGRVGEWLYRFILRAHPAEFRRRHEDELLSTFREAWADRVRGAGPWAALRFWWLLAKAEVRAGFRQRREGSLASARYGRASLASDLAVDLRFALRMFRRSPGLAAAVVLTLGIGIGGSSAVFGTFFTVYRSALPFRDGDRLVRLRSYTLGPSGEQRAYNFPPRDAVVVRDENRTFTGLVAMNGGSMALPGEGSPERVSAVGVTAGWNALLGIEPVLGRSFTADEEAAGESAGVALISHSLWQRRFGGDPAVVGRALAVDGGALTIVGVMPPRFNYPYAAEMWTPFRLDPTDARSHDLNAVARMRDGVDVGAARADMARIYEALREESPGTATDEGIQVTTVRQDFIREDGRMVQALLVAVGFFLLLACVNVANLLAAHFVARGREMGIRTALGAGGGRQLRQTLTETLVLFLAGGAVGLLLAGWLGDALLVLLPDVLRVELDMGTAGMGAPVAAFGLGTALLAGSISGAAAARRASRGDLRRVLHEGGRGTSTAGTGIQDALVVAELALSLVLLLGAGVMYGHFRRLSQEDLGFEPEGVETLQVSLEADRYADGQTRLQVVRSLEARLASLPGVDDVGVTSVNPLCCGDWGAPVEIEGRPPPPDGTPPHIIAHRYVTPGYFATMEIPVLRGSVFPGADRPAAALEVMVDATLARRHWPGEDPVGKRIRVARDGEPWRTVVGVVGAIRQLGDYDEGWYLPFYQEPMGRSNGMLHLMVRLRGEGVVAEVRRAIAQVDPGLPVFEVTAMSDLRHQNLSQDRLGAVLTSVFAVFGLLLATVGLYSLMAYLVGLRTREIGTRIALGASGADVLRLILIRAGRLVVLGSAAGLVLGLALNHVLRGIVPGVQMAGPGLLLPIVAVLLAVGGCAVLVPALRAVRVDPVRAFRAE